MKICANWAAQKKIGKIFVLMRSALGREIDNQMVHLAEILKPEYFAGAPNVAKNVAELDQNGGNGKYSYLYPTFMTRGLDQQLAEVRSFKSVDQTGPQNLLNIQIKVNSATRKTRNRKRKCPKIWIEYF